MSSAAAIAVPLPQAFFERMPSEVAPDLLGKLLHRDDGRLARLVEVEAYAPDDPAAHTFGGKTARNQSMFGPPGRLYVYLSYGIHWCANLVCGPEGYGAGVLLRAAEPLDGVARMRAARGREPLHELCSGPGRLAQAFGIDRGLDGADVTGGGVITMLDDGMRAIGIVACPRIGVSKNAAAPLRFLMAGSRHLSKPPPAARS
ncbi:MAG: DNA-3-methyladenine glycosylase [Pseudomonadota bacterium]